MALEEHVVIGAGLIKELKILNKRDVGNIPLTGKYTGMELRLERVATGEPNAEGYIPVAVTQVYDKKHIVIQLQEGMWSPFNIEEIPEGEDHRLTIQHNDVDDL